MRVCQGYFRLARHATELKKRSVSGSQLTLKKNKVGAAAFFSV
jgi:hypothetical protein